MHPSRHARRSFVAVVGSLLIFAGLLPPGAAPVFAVSTTLVINEVDYDQPSTDTAEFLELKNVGAAPIDLDPYTIELVNGATTSAYVTVQLPAFSLAPGSVYVVCGNATLTANCNLDTTPDQDLIQNGAPDAIGLRLGVDLVDAVSYEGLVPGFTEGTTAPTDTAAAAPAPAESISRCPDGADTDDNGADFDLRPITPGASNSCVAVDTPPSVATTTPANGAVNVAVTSDVSITFSEAVAVADGWFTISCATTGAHAAVATGGPVTFALNPSVDFGVDEACTVTILAGSVTDQDAPPDAMAMDHAFSFATAAAVNPAQPLPFAQNWTDIGQITTNDDWSGVPGILGFLGQEITTATGADPQTLLGVSAVANDIDVIANQTSTGIANGGVAEFHIPDPVVGLNGSGTADAPHLLINVSTSGHTDVRVSYNLRDLDASADNAAMQVALQYRVGTTGDFTNLPDGYVADATTADSATQVTPVSVLLPVAAWNQPWIQVRIITTNAVGNDEWVGVDDIEIVPDAADDAPAVASTVPANGATGVALDASISVTFDEPVSVTGEWFAISCDVSGAHVATASGGPDTFALDPAGTFASLELCTVTIEADGVSDNDLLDPPQFMAADFVFSFSALDASACGDPATQIHQIQGSGASTPMPNTTVSVEGVVTGDFNGTGGLGGFYIQDDSPDADPATSDGLFVGSTASVSSGDLVRVSGTATESFGETRVNALDLQLCGTGIIAPQAYDLPRPAGVTFEPVEGMLLTFPEALTATEHFQLGRFGEVTVSADGRLLQPTDHVAPGAPAQAELELAQRRRLLIDDGSKRPEPRRTSRT